MTRGESVQDLKPRSASVVGKKDISRELPFAPVRRRKKRQERW